MLNDMLLSEKKWMRSSAAYCLAIMATEEQLPLLKRGMEDPERSVRDKIKAAIERLAREGSKEAKALLVEFPEQTVVFQACENSSLDILADGTINIGQLFHEEAGFRALEVKRIAQKNDPKYLSVLYDCLEQESSDMVANEILSIICHFKPKDAVNQIAGKLNDSNPKLVNLAVSAIMKIDSEAGVPLVAGLLNHSDPDVATNTFKELKKASTELALGQVELLTHSLRTDQRRRGFSFLNMVEIDEAPEYYDKTILSLFTIEKEEKLVEEIADLYAHFATRETLKDYFNLKTELSRKKRAAKTGNGSISPLSEFKLKSLEKVRSDIAKKLTLSPEDLGTMEGTAANTLEETTGKKKAGEAAERESQIIKVEQQQARNRRTTIFATIMPILLIALISGGLWFSKPYWSGWLVPEINSLSPGIKTKTKARPSELGPIGTEVDIRCVVKKIRPLSNSLICTVKNKKLLLSAWFADKDLTDFKTGNEIRLKGIIEGTGSNARAIMLKGTLARNL
jgi:hypothetical protein